ncbi:hemin ABC transporter substrate-binding protein [Daeguia caeni]|uniref:Hemin ABC transporter substrate-binding protein n=1 Tax=Daeguia caeni TaxID=439612 RepID=A0ABV9H9N2_9HYPH
MLNLKKLCLAGMGVLAATVMSGAALAETVERFADTSRIVSVGGALTEIVYALGAEKMLVARDQTSLYPEEAQKLPDVGYMRQLSAEGVLSANPTGILLVEGSGPAETLDLLKKASVPMVIVPEEHSAEGVLVKIDAVGKALGLEDRAKELSDKIRSDLEEAEKMALQHNPRKRVLFIMSAPGGRLMAAGKDTAADGMIRLAGAENVISEFSGYKQLTDEAVEKAAPDAILMMDRGNGDNTHAVADELLKNPALAATPAGKSKNIIAMEGLYLLGFGPRTGAAARELSAKLYGEAGHQ